MSRSVVLAATFLALSGLTARAECTVAPFDFHPERNDNLVIDAVVVRGTTCEHRLGEGPGYRFTSREIARRPEHGSVGLAGNIVIRYTPARNFAGKDFYQLRVCAKKDGQSGCSNLFVVAQVR